MRSDEARKRLVNGLVKLGVAVPPCLGPDYDTATADELADALKDVSKQIKKSGKIALQRLYKVLVEILAIEDDDNNEPPDGGERQIA